MSPTQLRITSGPIGNDHERWIINGSPNITTLRICPQCTKLRQVNIDYEGGLHVKRVI